MLCLSIIVGCQKSGQATAAPTPCTCYTCSTNGNIIGEHYSFNCDCGTCGIAPSTPYESTPTPTPTPKPTATPTSTPTPTSLKLKALIGVNPGVIDIRPTLSGVVDAYCKMLKDTYTIFLCKEETYNYWTVIDGKFSVELMVKKDCGTANAVDMSTFKHYQNVEVIHTIKEAVDAWNSYSSADYRFNFYNWIIVKEMDIREIGTTDASIADAYSGGDPEKIYNINDPSYRAADIYVKFNGVIIGSKRVWYSIPQCDTCYYGDGTWLTGSINRVWWKEFKTPSNITLSFSGITNTNNARYYKSGKLLPLSIQDRNADGILSASEKVPDVIPNKVFSLTLQNPRYNCVWIGTLKDSGGTWTAIWSPIGNDVKLYYQYNNNDYTFFRSASTIDSTAYLGDVKCVKTIPNFQKYSAQYDYDTWDYLNWETVRYPGGYGGTVTVGIPPCAQDKPS